MDKHTNLAFKELNDQLKRHEEIIIQLLEIIGSTNRRVLDLANRQNKEKHLQ